MTMPHRFTRARVVWVVIVLALAGAPVALIGLGQVTSPPRDDPAATLFNDAEVARASGRIDDAIGKYQRVAAEHPSSRLAARSALEAARCLVAEGKWELAMKQMQDMRQRFPNTREAEEALERNTILHRLRLRRVRPLFGFARTAVNGSSSNIRRVLGVAVDSENRVYIAMRKSVAVFSDTGALVRTVPGDEFRALGVRGDAPVLFEEHGFREVAGPLVPVLLPDQGRQHEADIRAAALAADALVIGDRRTKAVHRISVNGSYGARLAAVDVTRLAVGPLGQIAAIERETQAVLLIAPDGTVRRVPVQGAGYQLRSPADLGFDPLGHLYLLERDAIIVFAPTGELLSVFAPANAIGAFRAGIALHVDAAGRLYVYDEDTERLQVYH
jgi:hypothetical protein